MAQPIPVVPRTEFEAPSYGFFYVLKIVALAFLTLSLQVGSAKFASRFWRSSSGGVPLTPASLRIPQSLIVLPGNSAVFKGELWVATTTTGRQMAGPIPTRGLSCHLMAFDLQTGKQRETGLTLPPSPLGLLVFQDKLWAVSEGVVSMVADGQVISRYPQRLLNEPTRSFLYKDQLAVIDRTRSNVHVLLTWHEGEWNEVGKVKVPASAYAARQNFSELRVISDQDSYYLFFADGRTISFHAGIPFDSDADPVSALEPENQLQDAGSAGPARDANWSATPIAGSWGTSWDVAMINGEIHLFGTISSKSKTTVGQLKFHNGNWSPVAGNMPAQISSFCLAGGPTGYLVDDNLELYNVDASRGIYRQQPNPNLTEYGRAVGNFLAWFGPYLVTTVTLVVISSWLMSRHRNSTYLYGKRTVNQASILQRGCARAIDSFLSIFPPAFWFIVAVTVIPEDESRYRVYGVPSSAHVVLFSIFGMWLSLILILSYMEGRFGCTPGKWICGIRTMGTTLRPCGMIRSLARELLIYIDSLFLLTWLPGVLLIAFTKNWQRLGDLASDTVVIVAPAAATPKEELR